MKYKFNKDKCIENMIPLAVGIIISIMVSYVLLNPEKFFTTFK